MSRPWGSVLFLADVSLLKPASGAEKVLHQQAVGLNRQGYTVLALTRCNGKGPDQVRQVDGLMEACYMADPGRRLKFFSGWLRKPGPLLKRLTEKRNVRAAVCHQPFTAASTILTGKINQIPIIYVFHSPSHEEFKASADNLGPLKKFSGALVRRAIEYCCLRKARRIVTLSHYMRDRLKRVHRVGERRIAVNPGGVELHRFSPPSSRSAVKRKLALPKDRVHLLTVRNLEPRMGIDNLLAAVADLKKKGYAIYLTIGGAGPEMHRLEALVDTLGLNGDVAMAGFIPDNLLPEYYGAADFFLLPTRSLEGFGLVTVEAMACGTPVLGTPVGAAPEILGRLDRRLIFKDALPEAMAEGIAENIAWFFKSPNRYRDLRRRCRDYAVANYSWERHIHTLITVIDSIAVENFSRVCKSR